MTNAARQPPDSRGATVHRISTSKGAFSAGSNRISVDGVRSAILSANFAIFLIVNRASSAVDDQLWILSGISCSWLLQSAKKAYTSSAGRERSIWFLITVIVLNP